MEPIYYDEVRNSDVFKQFLSLLDKIKNSLSSDLFIQKVNDGIESSNGKLSLYIKKDSAVKEFLIEATLQDDNNTICIWVDDNLKAIKSKFWDLVATFIMHECVHILRYRNSGEDQNTKGLTDDEYLLDERELNAYSAQSLYAEETDTLDFADDQYYECGTDEIYDQFLNWRAEIGD